MKMRGFLVMLCTAGLMMSAGAQESSAPDTSAFQEMLDSLGLSRDDLEAKVRSTLLFGGSSPVSFSGEARLKLQYHQMTDVPVYAEQDKSYISSNWEGNESFYRLGMVARAGRNTVLWSKIGFQHTLPGNYTNDGSIASRHDKSNVPAIIHEDMSAGLALRTVPISFWLKMGAVHWIEASPLTIWKSQPRTFAWEYLPFEVEQPIARYYEYNIAKGEKSGRAAWNKKSFQGINLESINLPGNIYLNLLYGTYERYDNLELDFYDVGGSLSLAGEQTSNTVKGKGIGDSYRHVFHGRLAFNELLGRLTPAANIMAFNYDEDIYQDINWRALFTYNDRTLGRKAYVKEPFIGSLDLRGPINDKLSIHTDLAFSRIDTNWIVADVIGVDSLNRDIIGRTQKTNWSPWSAAFYTRLESKYGLPVKADFAVIGDDFYSPLSFAAPIDAFYPFGSNLLGPGKFIARGEASPYAKNMAGVNLCVEPKLKGYGHLRIIYGQHFQLKEEQDLIFFPYRLNGQDMFSFFHSSYTRWGNDLLDFSLNGKYIQRMGDYSTGKPNATGGGLRSDYLAVFESFVPYDDISMARANQANANKKDLYGNSKNPDGAYSYSNVNVTTSFNQATGVYDTIRDTTNMVSTTGFVPHNRKFTFNLEADYAFDLGPVVGYSKDLFFSVYGALNGVSTSFKPLSFSDEKEDMLLWGAYVRFEPAIALSKKFYIIGLAGFENWRSQKAYIYNGTVEHKPIDYRDYAIGIGFDWDMLSRVGLHGRVKYMQHDDITIPENNYKTPVVSTEIKMWF